MTRIYVETERSGPLGLKPRSGGWFSKNKLYRTNAPPEQTTLQEQPLTGESGTLLRGPESRPAEVRIDDTPDILAKDRLSARREAYLNAGWQFFEEERFREACENFGMADQIVFVDASRRAEFLRKRAEVKLAIVYASIAGGRYAQAANALTWLLQRDRVTGELPDPLFLARIKDIREKYARPALFDAHLAGLEKQVAAEKQVPQLIALRAVALWGDAGNRQSRINAKFEARRLSEPVVPPPWRDLSPAMLRAEAAFEGEDAEANANGAAWRPTDIRLPWEKPAEGSPTSRPVPAGR